VHDRLETERLVGRRVTREHFEALLAIYNDPRVAEWLGGPRSRSEWLNWLGSRLTHWDRHGYGDWVFEERDGNALVGRAGLRWVTIDQQSEVEVGYAVAADRWRSGFATEMTAAVLEAGFGAGLESIVAFTLPDNAASRRVLEKCGLTYEKEIDWAARPHVLYRIRKGSSSDG
jgi:RimJ/RimL family protein N-acetyltransferase